MKFEHDSIQKRRRQKTVIDDAGEVCRSAPLRDSLWIMALSAVGVWTWFVLVAAWVRWLLR